ncbi:MFS family permease [Pseudomonas lini]|uniref:MFS transporter n=1 Tax=Pseudomonas lini TaxID=163011 RepID=UPI00277FB6A6|nr:MFS transporter [Pseudomonas lini]MDQ0122126.1 MFS family permease [Pseudomonas lini]
MKNLPKKVGTLPYRLSTRIAFFVAGFLMASWAPLVAYAKSRLELNEATLGLLLLCVGIGSLICMPLAGPLAQRVGLRKLIISSSLVFCATLPGLAIASDLMVMAALLLLFGASLGLLDISINFQAAAVERAAGMPLMSGFHGFFSIGTFVGASSGTALLSTGASPLFVTLIAAALGSLLILVTHPRLIPSMPDSSSNFFARPRGTVSLLAALTFICLLVEGAMLDWGAILLGTLQHVPSASGAIGYSLFTLTMSIGRLSGDWASAKFGDKNLLQSGAAIGVAGFALILTQDLNGALLGYMLIGIGVANIVPILFRAALNQHDVPSAQALSAVATVGYLGVLMGPAAIGFVSHATSIKVAFTGLAALLGIVLLAATFVARGSIPANQES